MDGMTYVRALETLLSMRGFTKKMFYAATGISDSTISQYRSGYAKTASNSTIRRTAQFFNMTVEEFENTPEQFNLSGIKKDSPNPETEGVLKELISKILLLSPEKQKQILKIIDALD